MKSNFTIKELSIILLLLMSFVISPYSMQAQEETDEDLYELDLEALMNIEVVSASKISQKQSDAPNIISLIPKDQVRSYGWISTNEVLAYQPGFYPAQDYDRRVVGLRGMFEGWNNNHMLMLVDGVPFNDNLYGTAYTWEITPLIFTKNMEVIRGPGGALYGTNAMNGVVTLNTMKANDFKSVGIARSRFGSNNTQIYDFAVGKENNNVGMVVAVNHYNTNGNEYDSYDASGLVDNAGNLQEFKVQDKRSSTYLFSHIYGKGNFDGLSFQYHEQHWDYKTGHGWLFEIPDRPENLREYRRLITLRYAPKSKGNFNYELTSRYQIHGIDWNLRYYKNNAFGGYYPNSVTEYLKTDAEDIFTRFQVNYNMNDHIFLAGIETDFFMYNGDEAHHSNTDLNDAGGFYYIDSTFINPNEGWWAPFPNNEDQQMGPWFEYIKDKTVNNMAGFVQYVSPKFADKIQLTASGRFDQMFFDYVKIGDPNKPTESKTFDMVTPRVALVFNATDDITLKAIYGKAFRTPAPTEMFGSNTWTLASNIEQLEPELATNFDFGLDWSINQNLNWRLNGFWVNFENQIAYSMQNANLSTNIFSYETGGIETELQYSFGNISGFANFTYAIRLSEDIADTTISEHQDIVTWAPGNTANVGLRYTHSKFYVSALMHYQGKMNRRDTDKVVGLEQYRPMDAVDGWIDLGLKVAYKFKNNVELAIIGKNLLDEDQYFVKNYAYAFDYRWEKRQIFAELLFNF